MDDDAAGAGGGRCPGGRAAARWRPAGLRHVGGRELLVAGDPRDPISWGSYPMAPWAGRVNLGRFAFDGRDAPAAHHHGPPRDPRRRVRPAVVGRGDDTIAIDLDDRWPFRGRVVQRFALDEDGLEVTMTVDRGRADARRDRLAPVVPARPRPRAPSPWAWRSGPARCSCAAPTGSRRGSGCRRPPAPGTTRSRISPRTPSSSGPVSCACRSRPPARGGWSTRCRSTRSAWSPSRGRRTGSAVAGRTGIARRGGPGPADGALHALVLDAPGLTAILG